MSDEQRWDIHAALDVLLAGYGSDNRYRTQRRKHYAAVDKDGYEGPRK
jgi:hypothetical protein